VKLKRDWKRFRDILRENGVRELYHFTDRSNLRSIKLRGGLYSGYYCAQNGIAIPCPGGNELSRGLDQKYGLEDYVRLGFNRNPPMMIVACREGIISDPVIIVVDTSVVHWAPTLFSDMNATDSLATRGDDLASFQAIRFDIARSSTWSGEMEKKWRQAEVMVKTHIPLKYLKLP
jgi:hypothetical protein